MFLFLPRPRLVGLSIPYNPVTSISSPKQMTPTRNIFREKKAIILKTQIQYDNKPRRKYLGFISKLRA